MGIEEATEFIVGAMGGGATGGGGPFIVDDADGASSTKLSPHVQNVFSVVSRVSINVCDAQHGGERRRGVVAAAEANRLLFHAKRPLLPVRTRSRISAC